MTTLAVRRRVRDEIAELKVARGCADCGYNAHAVALDFDHPPGAGKLIGVARAVRNGALPQALREAAKCDVVCANCHRVRSLAREDFGRSRST